jgi:hypothetical protein
MTDNALASNADIPLYTTPGTSAAREAVDATSRLHVLETNAASRSIGEVPGLVFAMARHGNPLQTQNVAVGTRALENEQAVHQTMGHYPVAYPTAGRNQDRSLIDSLSVPRQAIGGQGNLAEPTIYKMRAWNLTLSAYEFWVVVGGPNANNPSGQPILAGSVTVVAVKRPKDLVGQGPS